jgi:radical SAM protein with 4Fe4S-binding SPASM domain
MIRIAEKLDTNGIMNLTISGGEPFVRPDILEILKKIADLNFFWVCILSNGTLLTEEHLDFLCRNNKIFTVMQFSAFSHKSEINDSYEGVPGALDRILQNGKRLMASGIKVIIAVNLFDFNIPEIQITRDFFTSQGFCISFAIRKVTNDCNIRHIDKHYHTAPFFSDCLHALQNRDLSNIKLHIEEALQKTTRKEISTCLKKNISIDHKGGIYPCHRFTSLPLGSILESLSISETLRSSEAYNNVLRTTCEDLGECNTCKMYNVCTICLADRFNSNSITQAPKVMCELANSLHSFYEESA